MPVPSMMKIGQIRSSTVSVFARGSGDVTVAALNGFSILSQASYSLADDWQRLTVTFTAAGGQTALRFRVYSAGAGASVQLAGFQPAALFGAGNLQVIGGFLAGFVPPATAPPMPASTCALIIVAT